MDRQPLWTPFQPPNDCSQGFCSIYCPQWCYFLYPPPPPPINPTVGDDLGSDFDSSPALSPLLIAIIALTVTALLLFGYYIAYRYWQRHHHHRPASGPASDPQEGSPSRHGSLSNGLDDSLIEKIVVCKYRKGDGLVAATNCSVCLSDFREDENLRLLPKCNHAFHVQCIDTWLKSQSNCPLCRAGIVWSTPQLRLPAPDGLEGNRSAQANEAVEVVLQDSEIILGNDNEEVSKGPSDTLCDVGGVQERYSVVEIRDDGVQLIRRSGSMSSSCRGQDSIDDDNNGGRAKSGEVSWVMETMVSSTGSRGEEVR